MSENIYIPEPLTAKFFEAAMLTDVPIRDANGAVVHNADGTVQTTKGELRDLIVPMASDRATVLAQATRNHKAFVEEGNAWVGELERVLQEMERIRPTGGNVDKKGGDGGLSGSISAQTANTLWDLRDNSGARFLTKYFVFTSPELDAYKLANPAQAPLFNGFPGFRTTVPMKHMTDSQAFSFFDNAMKTVVDQATQKVQLDQTTLQGLLSRQNNAVEAMADLQSKFASTMDKIVGNFRRG